MAIVAKTVNGETKGNKNQNGLEKLIRPDR